MQRLSTRPLRSSRPPKFDVGSGERKVAVHSRSLLPKAAARGLRPLSRRGLGQRPIVLFPATTFAGLATRTFKLRGVSLKRVL